MVQLYGGVDEAKTATELAEAYLDFFAGDDGFHRYSPKTSAIARKIKAASNDTVEVIDPSRPQNALGPLYDDDQKLGPYHRYCYLRIVRSGAGCVQAVRSTGRFIRLLQPTNLVPAAF
jgi:hypothetical protein